MRKVPVPKVVTTIEAPESPLPPKIQEALGELVGAAREGLLALSTGVGLGVVHELMELEVDEVVGPKGTHNPDRVAKRHGHEDGSMTLGGRRVAVRRPRMRTADDQHELPMETYEYFADRDPLTRAVRDDGGDRRSRSRSALGHPCRAQSVHCGDRGGPVGDRPDDDEPLGLEQGGANDPDIAGAAKVTSAPVDLDGVPVPDGAYRHGDRAAQARLLALYEPLAQAIVRGLFLLGGEREDLAQHARLGIVHALRDWDPARGAPFKPFVRLCVVREARMAYLAARARKHQPLNAAVPLDAPGRPLDGFAEADCVTGEERLAGVRADADPVLKTLARERLREIRERLPSLSALERDALALAASGHSHREIAGALGVSRRAVNNALQRARAKLSERAAA
jgi:RNA polymerase sigma-H factor